MTFLAELWLPILTAAVFVFIASSVLHMCIPIHRSDYSKLSDEAKVMETIRSMGIQPGEYLSPLDHFSLFHQHLLQLPGNTKGQFRPLRGIYAAGKGTHRIGGAAFHQEKFYRSRCRWRYRLLGRATAYQ